MVSPIPNLNTPDREVRPGSVDRDLCHRAARNNNRLRALFDCVELSAHRVCAASFVVGQVSARMPGSGDEPHWVVPVVVDDSRVDTHRCGTLLFSANELTAIS